MKKIVFALLIAVAVYSAAAHSMKSDISKNSAETSHSNIGLCDPCS